MSDSKTPVIEEWDIIRITVPLEAYDTEHVLRKLPAGTEGDVIEILEDGAVFQVGFEIFAPHNRLRAIAAVITTIPANQCELSIKCV